MSKKYGSKGKTVVEPEGNYWCKYGKVGHIATPTNSPENQKTTCSSKAPHVKNSSKRRTG